MRNVNRFSVYEKMLSDLGKPLKPGTALLDFGCGAGCLVKSAYESGLDAYGCDIDFGSEWVDQSVLAALRAANRVRVIGGNVGNKASPLSGDAYRLPFDDNLFDVVISDQVFEHVQNYPEAIAEIRRVLKPGGVFLHIFPSRYIPIEPHLFVPLASFFHPHWWLTLWASLGVRNRYQSGWTRGKVVAENKQFLRTMTNYLREADLIKYFSAGFFIHFAERQFMRYSQRAKLFVLPWLYRTFWSRCVFGIKL